ncbi:DUF6966 domain-containing protein [Undibacterium sp. MH2W]|uniref:DUF6966 domain-containing protein n=1 Tax=Undibacterium sp. MH2W TaxID=3413044 RepID=UPI003BF3B8FF
MHSDLVRLADWLDEAAALLLKHEIQHWADWLSKDSKWIRSGDFYGIEHLRSAFGGMGSLNDLGLTMTAPENPKLLVSSPDDERFQWLLSQIYELTVRLFREES